MSKNKIVTLGTLGALAVILGAFGAHGLKPKLDATQLAAYQTGVQYHFIHTLAMLGILCLTDKINSGWINRSFWMFLIGIIFFSGSLYLLSTADVLGISGLKKVLGPITPIGGLCFIIGWIMLILAALKQENSGE